MKLFIASTPYNIFNCINIKLSLLKTEPADIIISNFDNKNQKYAQNLIKENIFNNVFFVEQRKFNEHDNIKFKPKRFIMKFYDEIVNRYFYKKLFNTYCKEIGSQKKYDEIYLDSFGYMPRFVFNYFYSKNKNIKIYKVDCGVESYYDAKDYNKLTLKQSFIRNKIQKCLNGYCLYDSTVAIMKKKDIILIPKLNVKDENFKRVVNRIFEYQPFDFNIKEQNIFLDQILEDDESLSKIQKNVVDIMNHTAGFNYAVKLHPRTPEDSTLYCGKSVIKTKNTFEMLLLNNPDFSKKNIITLFSTAATLPKLLLEEEPNIVCLVNLFKNKFIEGELTCQFFDRLKLSYNNSDKVIMCESIEEFKEQINKLGKNI